MESVQTTWGTTRSCRTGGSRPKRRFFLLARFYGPKPELFAGKFQLNNIELMK
jgi:hypothetical protein